MPKDPAMLWYWNDWNGGTYTMNRHLKGCYMDLLSAQFNSGPLSIDQIKTVLGTDQAKWTVLSKKFKRELNSDGVEVFSNERMETEKNKRAKFSSEQRERVDKRWKKYRGNTGVLPNVNENENKEDRGLGKGEGFFANEIPKNMELTNLEILAVQEFIAITVKKNLTEIEVKDYWKAFKINQFGGKEWYTNRESLLKHFRHSLKLELKNELNLNGKEKISEKSTAAPLKYVS